MAGSVRDRAIKALRRWIDAHTTPHRGSPVVTQPQWTPPIWDLTLGRPRVLIVDIPGSVPVGLAPDLRWHVIETDEQGDYLGRVVTGPDDPTLAAVAAPDTTQET